MQMSHSANSAILCICASQHAATRDAACFGFWNRLHRIRMLRSSATSRTDSKTLHIVKLLDVTICIFNLLGLYPEEHGFHMGCTCKAEGTQRIWWAFPFLPRFHALRSRLRLMMPFAQHCTLWGGGYARCFRCAKASKKSHRLLPILVCS